MELLEAIKSRRSIRRYKPEEPPREVIEELLQEAQWAPSNMNLQAWNLVAVRGKERDELARVVKESTRYIKKKLDLEFADKPKVIEFTMKFFENLGGAPVIVLAYIPKRKKPEEAETLEHKDRDFEHLTNIQSAAAVVYNLTLLAHARGLGACWMTGPTYVAGEVNRFLGIEDQELVAIVPIGYPDQSPPAPPRKGYKIRWVGYEP